jgi:hypothetical protein
MGASLMARLDAGSSCEDPDAESDIGHREHRESAERKDRHQAKPQQAQRMASLGQLATG